LDLRSILPERSFEDIIAERVRLTIGGKEYILPAKVIEDNETWLAGLNAEFMSLMNALSKQTEDTGAIVGLLTRDPDWLIDHLISYDHTNALPDRAAIRKGLTPMKLLLSVGEVWRAANPLVDTLLGAMTLSNLRAVTSPGQNGSSAHTASPPRSSVGPRAKSAKS
jgi:hypothetical protein